jgi:hydrogenase nickel incorporation protein HypB
VTKVSLIEVKEDILSENKELAGQLREKLRAEGVFMLNLMSSPGSGKTSLILQSLAALKNKFSIGVIEGDIDATVDADKISLEGVPAVQLRTGGFCHLDSRMIELALNKLDLHLLDCVIIENVGNLVCPAEFDTGAQKRAMILSVPEGDDKPLKYPLMFSVCDVLIVNKIDYIGTSDFDLERLRQRVLKLNPGIQIFSLSCKTGAGMPGWLRWLGEQIERCRDDI